MIDKSIALNRPATLTKELALSHHAEHGRRVVISSNFLDAFGFSPNCRYDRTAIGNGAAGFALRLAPEGVQQVYRRAYTRRRSNPFESQIHINAREFLDHTIPTWSERVHVTMKPGELLVRPVPNHAFHIRKLHRDPRTALSAFMALSSGVDAYSIEKQGFKIAAIVERRPEEAHDGTQNFTESGVLTAVANVSPFAVFNEDITRLDMGHVREALGDRPISMLHACVQCDDHSRLKNNSDKRRAVLDGTSTRDMVYDVLRLAETLRPATVLVECVEPFAGSSECDMLAVRLRRWGFDVQVAVLDARDHGGYSSRRRAYLVGSLFPGFTFPEPTPRRTTPIWPDFADEIAKCRDVSGSSSVQKGMAVGRDGHLTPEATYAPTLVKSQSHMPKDALYLRTSDGRVLFPTEKMFARLNEIPDDFTFEATTATLALEQIGQSISFSMHDRLIASLKEHLLIQRGERMPTARTADVTRLETPPAPKAAEAQFTLNI
jgi:DNA (cytosine-5)-methyltransferase 1